MLNASEVAKLLGEFGQRTELSDESPFKARAYFKAAESLLALTVPLGEVVAQGRLRDIPGVGPAIADKVQALHRSGTHKTLERLRAEVPAAALEMLRIPGLPTPKVRQIYRELGIASLPELEEACRLDRLKDVKGLGPALQKRILQGIALLQQSRGSRLIHHAGDLLEATAANLRGSHPELEKIVPAGEFRRGCELVHALRIVAEMPERAAGIGSARINDDVEITLAGGDRYGVALLLATGSSEHFEELARLAAGQGLSLDEEGLRRGEELIACPDEAAVYRALGLPEIPPELREGNDEIALATEGRLPHLVRPEDIRGVLHCHTTRSDGGNSLEEMADAARARGYFYFGVADHSKSAGYAGGLSVEAIAAQHDEADGLNRQFRGEFRVLKGIESDILVDGSLDYPDDVLARFDFVVASVHSRFQMAEEQQTERILRAVANPFTTILGHMTGRMLLRREGYEVDIERILQGCAEHGVAVEINANPHRLDLDWRWHRRAVELGCTMSINPDAHSTSELDLMRWGLGMARKGGVPAGRVLNCMGLGEITAFLTERARRRRS